MSFDDTLGYLSTTRISLAELADRWAEEQPHHSLVDVARLAQSIVQYYPDCIDLSAGPPADARFDPQIHLDFMGGRNPSKRVYREYLEMMVPELIELRGWVPLKRDGGQLPSFCDHIYLNRDNFKRALSTMGHEIPAFLEPPLPRQTPPPSEPNENLDALANGPDPQQCSEWDGYKSVRWYGTLYTFNDSQARAIGVLWKASQNGWNAVSSDEIKQRCAPNSPHFKVSNLFRQASSTTGKHPAWGVMIQPISRGMYALCPPDGRP